MAIETETTRTEHPHIVMTPGVCGGRPRIDGTRISVEFIARQVAAGERAEVIVESLPHLTLASVYDALGYYHDHKAEIDASIAENTPEALDAKYKITRGDHGQLIFGDLPPK